jgi:hypothetical protein
MKKKDGEKTVSWWTKVKCQHEFQRISQYVEICACCSYMRIVNELKKEKS